MPKKLKILVTIVLISLVTFTISACDPGIYDLPGANDSNPFEGIDLRDFLDSEVCYNQLLEDLEFMNSTCYYDSNLAGAQAYTILMSYGLADMSKKSSSLTSEQLETKSYLYDAIKWINLYSNNYMESDLYQFNPFAIQEKTNEALKHCRKMLTYFK